MLRTFSLILPLLFLPLILPTQENGQFTDTRDGRVYPWVKIGNQTWMAENLAWFPSVNRVGDGLFEEECYYAYGYDGDDLEKAKATETWQKYGTLYNYAAAQKACPSGWHLPSDGEWKELEAFLGMEVKSGQRGWIATGDVGKKLKSTTGWLNNTGTNDVGFNAIPGGCRGYGGFESLGYCGYFWTASPTNGDNGWRRGICGDDDRICREEDRRYFGVSVRCIKND